MLKTNFINTCLTTIMGRCIVQYIKKKNAKTS